MKEEIEIGVDKKSRKIKAKKQIQICKVSKTKWVNLALLEYDLSMDFNYLTVRLYDLIVYSSNKCYLYWYFILHQIYIN